jgi:hypothetical protein
MKRNFSASCGHVLKSPRLREGWIGGRCASSWRESEPNTAGFICFHEFCRLLRGAQRVYIDRLNFIVGRQLETVFEQRAQHHPKGI